MLDTATGSATGSASAAATGPSRRREATRQRLLDAAAQVFAEVGLDAASVEAVCEAAGFTRGAFYSNFASKEELFLELCARRASAQIAAVRAVVEEFEPAERSDRAVLDTVALVRRVLEVSAADRLAVLLMSEVRIHALRNPSVAAAYRRQGIEMTGEVAQILRDLTRAKGIALRVSELRAAELFVKVWAAAAEEAVMDGLDEAGFRGRIGEALTGVAELVIADER